MERSTECGMQTFDKALEDLYFNDIISLNEALHYADSKNNLRLHISLSNKVPADEDERLLLSQAQPIELEDSEPDPAAIFPKKKGPEKDSFSLLEE
jgi:twitching motility protein PilU